MPPRFLYFDLGKVLVDFDHERMFRQMGAVVGVDSQRMRIAVQESGLQKQYELGTISGPEFHAALCSSLACTADYEQLNRAGCEIFQLNDSMLPVVGDLKRAGCRMGILSNTCAPHWEYCLREFPMLREFFDVYALSCRIGACKPEPAIFLTAAELAGVAPAEIFFTDDIAEHVVAARAVGFDAVQYTGTPALVEELRDRGLLNP